MKVEKKDIEKTVVYERHILIDLNEAEFSELQFILWKVGMGRHKITDETKQAAKKLWLDLVQNYHGEL